MGMERGEKEKLRMEKYFFMVESLQYSLYKELAKRERNGNLRKLLLKLVETEERHVSVWRGAVMEHQRDEPRPSFLVSVQVVFYLALRSAFGVAFVTRLLEKDESRVLGEYVEALKRIRFSARERAAVKRIIDDEQVHEDELAEEMRVYEGEANYLRSIVYGLNDGLVELLAVVVGLAVIATSPIVVVVGGLVVGISGTLSMGGGAYLSSKAEAITEASEGRTQSGRPRPRREALYTGVYYFIGALISILPFGLGLSGPAGIIAAVVLVAVALTIASVVIAVISKTSIKRRVAEMLTISLTAAAITIMLGYVIRTFFGITI